uniref:Secreted protein n=1 Tax=Setaria viridis TaxID=4556 RepID=A0A4U6TI26_SETVI|nr:hypothetical protein SEVIR_8G112632v2 [Setaria viridis]
MCLYPYLLRLGVLPCFVCGSSCGRGGTVWVHGRSGRQWLGIHGGAGRRRVRRSGLAGGSHHQCSSGYGPQLGCLGGSHFGLLVEPWR